MMPPVLKRYISQRDILIIREVLLFEKIAATQCSYSISTISSQIIFITFSKNPECYPCLFSLQFFLYHQTKYHSILSISYQPYPEIFQHKSALFEQIHVLKYFYCNDIHSSFKQMATVDNLVVLSVVFGKTIDEILVLDQACNEKLSA